LLLILAFLFLFKSSSDQKSLIIICLMFLVVFMAKISPQNNEYVIKTIKNIFYLYKKTTATPVIKKPDVVPGPEEKKRAIAIRYLDSIRYIMNNRELHQTPSRATQLPKTDKGRILIIGPNINKPPYLTSTDTTPEQKRLLNFISTYSFKLPLAGQSTFKPGLPGKVIGLLQTENFFLHHPAKIIAGEGMGNFSSKLAFRASGLGFAGSYPEHHAFINGDFFPNHLDLYLNYFSRRSGLHSAINSPYSVYDQVLAEYGLLGLSAFLIFYLGFFIKHYKKLTYGIPMLMLILCVFFIDYWFEQLSVIVFFELLLLLNIKETTYLKPVSYGHK
jgi:hypothetical protein